MVREARFAWDGADARDYLDRRDRFDELDDDLLDPFAPARRRDRKRVSSPPRKNRKRRLKKPQKNAPQINPPQKNPAQEKSSRQNSPRRHLADADWIDDRPPNDEPNA